MSAALLSTVLLGTTSAIIPVHAAKPVIDVKNIAEAKKMLSELKKQLEKLEEANEKLQEQVNAIGRFGKISIPTINADKIRAQLTRDAGCLLPDLSRLLPNVEFDEIDFGSICEAGDAYRQKLWISPEALSKISWNKKKEKLDEIRGRRENVLVDAASKGLGHADIAQKVADDANQAASEIDSAADSAKDTNTRLTVVAKALASSIRVQAQTNQILAQLLKVNSAFAMKAGVRVDNALAEDEDKKKGSDQ